MRRSSFFRKRPLSFRRAAFIPGNGFPRPGLRRAGHSLRKRPRASPLRVRYLPQFSLKTPVSASWNFDIEASVNASLTLDAASGWGSRKGDLALYRLWARLTTARFEARLGLQKIEFGSARLLRPLMWFDRLDPNDPLQLTDGVTGLLLKYTFQSNVSVWAWGLTGNNDRKGWESFPTRAGTVEYGGRAQVPALGGELAVTIHRRSLDAFRGPLPLASDERSGVPESRLGLDGYWDLGLGLWFEAVFTKQDFQVFPFRHQKAVNLGGEHVRPGERPHPPGRASPLHRPPGSGSGERAAPRAPFPSITLWVFSTASGSWFSATGRAGTGTVS